MNSHSAGYQPLRLQNKINKKGPLIQVTVAVVEDRRESEDYSKSKMTSARIIINPNFSRILLTKSNSDFYQQSFLGKRQDGAIRARWLQIAFWGQAGTHTKALEMGQGVSTYKYNTAHKYETQPNGVVRIKVIVDQGNSHREWSLKKVEAAECGYLRKSPSALWRHTENAKNF